LRIAAALALVLSLNAPSQAVDLIQFWDTPQHGGNSFNRLPPDAAYFKALHDYGATWVRLSYDKWKPQGRDFLLGDADHYQGLHEQDLKADVLKPLGASDVHWAFYSFREDAWDGMDYELGNAKVGWKYWQAVDDNKPDPINRKATPQFEPIARRLKGAAQ